MRHFLTILAATGFLAGPAFAYAPKVACELDRNVNRGLASLEEVDTRPVGSTGLASLAVYGQAGS